MILSIENLYKHFNGIAALDNFSCGIGEGEIVGLIGPNGAGKTTLFNVITGFLKADSGQARLAGRQVLGRPPSSIYRMGMVRTFQNLRLIRQMSVLDNVRLAFAIQKGESLFHLFSRPKSISAQEKANTEKAMALLKEAGIQGKAPDPAGTLSYGQQKLLSLVCCLASDPEVLLLDEPVAGINPAMIEKIIQIITGLPDKGKTVLLIEHNIDMVMSVCDRVIFMDMGRKISEGKPEAVRKDPEVIEAYLD